MEPFGLSLTGVYSADYPLRLKSWVGQTPTLKISVLMETLRQDQFVIELS